MKKSTRFCIVLLFIFPSIVNLTNGQVTHPVTKWKFTTQGTIRGGAVIANDKIVFGNAEGFVYCINKNDGEQIWKFKTDGAIVSDPAIDLSLNIVYMVSRDQNIYALDLYSGHLKWRFEMLSDLKSPFHTWEYFMAAPSIGNNMVFIGSGNGHLYALDKNSGKLIWKFKTNRRIRSTTIFHNEILYQASNDGYLYALSANDGKLLWKFETEGATLKSSDFGFDRNSIYSKPVVVNDVIIFGSRDGKTYAVDLNTHLEKWKRTYGSAWSMAVAADNDNVYVGWSSNNLVSAHDIKSGEERWTFQPGAHNYARPLVVGNHVYIGSADGNLYQLNKSSGQQNWAYGVNSEIFSSPIYQDEVIYFGADDGVFYALQQGLTPFLAVYQPDNGGAFPTVDPKIAPYLQEAGFEVLDSAKLYQFIDARINDSIPSVIVLAYDGIPSNIIGQQPENGMMRQYLSKGGKLISFGGIPNFFKKEASGNYTRDPVTGAKMIGVQYDHPEESGNYYARATQIGLNFGLPVWTKSTNTTINDPNVVALAIDEYGRTSIWLKKYHSRPGSGFISCRTWGWNTSIKDKDLEIIRTLATYGLL